MLISSALAHGTSGSGSVGGFGPLILLAAATLFILVFVINAKWRQRKPGDKGDGDRLDIDPIKKYD